MGEIERWFLCENCGRIGPISDFQAECRPGWPHSRLQPVDMKSPTLTQLRGAVTDDMIERGAAALWAEHGTTVDDFGDPDEREAAWGNACADAEAVLRAALGDGS